MVRVKVINYPRGYREIIISEGIINKKNNKKGGRKKNKYDTDDVNRKRRVYRVKRDIKRLALMNKLTRMMTLTFRDNIINVNEADKYFKKYIYALKEKGIKDLKYIMVRELQQRGAVHYHVLIDRYIPHKMAYEIWLNVTGGGSVNLKLHGLKGIFYCIKYIEKTMEENIFETQKGFSKKIYTTSKNLERDISKISKEFYCFVNEAKKDNLLDSLMGKGGQVVKEIREAEKDNRLLYIKEGMFEGEKYKYICIMIKPKWDKCIIDR